MSAKSLHSMTLPLTWAASLLILSACMSERTMDLPPQATLETSGNDRLVYTAPNDGTIWIVDADHDRILYSGAVLAHDTVAVDPDVNKISVSGRTVADKVINRGEKHKVFFEPMSSTADHHN